MSVKGIELTAEVLAFLQTRRRGAASAGIRQACDPRGTTGYFVRQIARTSK